MRDEIIELVLDYYIGLENEIVDNYANSGSGKYGKPPTKYVIKLVLETV